jgi:hypothetical protein
MAAPKRRLSDIKYITLHHSAVPNDGRFPNLRAEARQFDLWHKSRSWAEAMKTPGEQGCKYIAYHYLVNDKGEHLHTQNIEYERYHASDSGRGAESHNKYGIGICMSGYFHYPYNEVPTEAQWKKVGTLIYRLEKKLNRSLIVRGHRETALAATSCPGDKVGNYNEKFIKRIIDYTNWLHKNGEPIEDTCEEKLKAATEENKVLKLESSELRGMLQASQAEVKTLQGRIDEAIKSLTS